jgi:hypothetical protein
MSSYTAPHPMMTRSKTAAWRKRNAKREGRTRGEWEDCYAVIKNVDNLIGNWRHLEDFQTYEIEDVVAGRFRYLRFHTVYYQTYGGGPEGGYFVMYVEDSTNPDENNKANICGIYAVQRDWCKPFVIKENLSRIGARIDYQDCGDRGSRIRVSTPY